VGGDQKASVAAACLQGAESGSMSFPEIVGTLMATGFESYLIDYRRSLAIYYLPDGDSVELTARKVEQAVASTFDAPAIRAAIMEAQDSVPGYTYDGFCRKTAAAGCAGYIVSFSGRRVLYFGRTAETHVEHFPQ
jgi:uncharacterized protein YbcV (DUF1398 family)